jgi:hypothetical protein
MSARQSAPYYSPFSMDDPYRAVAWPECTRRCVASIVRRDYSASYHTTHTQDTTPHRCQLSRDDGQATSTHVDVVMPSAPKMEPITMRIRTSRYRTRGRLRYLLKMAYLNNSYCSLVRPANRYRTALAAGLKRCSHCGRPIRQPNLVVLEVSLRYCW